MTNNRKMIELLEQADALIDQAYHLSQQEPEEPIIWQFRSNMTAIGNIINESKGLIPKSQTIWYNVWQKDNGIGDIFAVKYYNETVAMQNRNFYEKHNYILLGTHQAEILV